MSFVQQFLTNAFDGPVALPVQATKALAAMQGLYAGMAAAIATGAPFQTLDVNAFVESVFDPGNTSIVPGVDMTDVESILSATEILTTAIESVAVTEQQTQEQQAPMRLRSARLVQQVSEMPAYVSQASVDDEDFI